MSDYAEEMGMDELWDETMENAPDAPTGGKLPDGRYPDAFIAISRFERPTWAEEGQRIWQLYIYWVVDGKGGASDYLVFDPEEDQEHLKRRIEKVKHMGYTGTFGGLMQFTEGGGFLNQVFDITVKTKPGEKRDFTNIYLNSGPKGVRTEGVDYSAPMEGAAADDLDDIPF